MHIRRLEINNFRGIEEATWLVPEDRKFICFIGPGDSGKTSILDALHFTLGDRYSLSISDTDFYDCNTANPICIRVIVTDIPKELLKDSAFGLHLSGIEEDGKLHQDPEDGLTPCLIIQLKIDETHEPRWTVERVDGSESTEIRSSHRHYLATFKVDERADVHLRWTNTSALGRLSRDKNSSVRAMASAARAASQAIAEHEDSDLTDLTSKVQTKINQAGGGSFSSMKPGLDTSISSAGGNLALYEAGIPLTNYGLGTKRISGLAVQQIASPNKSVLLIDEIETGLEPHRLVRLMAYLRDDPDYSQILITTHSPIAVEQALTENLAVVRSSNGKVSIKFLPDDNDAALRLRRSRPSSFLANKIVVAEGKTEEGLLLEHIESWNTQRITEGLPVASGEGAVIQDGQGGSDAPIRAKILSDLGYSTAIFIDNDDRSVDAHVTEAEAANVTVVRWDTDNNTERQIITCLPDDSINSFLTLGVEARVDAATVISDLKQAGLPGECETLEFETWAAHGIGLAQARELIFQAATSKKWFKNVDGGKLLGRWLLDNPALFAGTAVEERINSVKDFIYSPNAEEIDADQPDAGE